MKLSAKTTRLWQAISGSLNVWRAQAAQKLWQARRLKDRQP